MVSWSNILQRIFAHFNMRHPMSPAVTVNIDQINYSLLMTYEKDKKDILLNLRSRQTSSCSHSFEIPRSFESLHLCSKSFVHWWHLNVLPIFIRHAKIHASFWESKKIFITQAWNYKLFCLKQDTYTWGVINGMMTRLDMNAGPPS